MLVNGLGMRLHASISERNAHDTAKAKELIENAKGDYLLADWGYYSAQIVKAIEARGISALIPTRSNNLSPRKLGGRRYRNKNVIEKSFHKLKLSRRMSSRFSKI